MVHSEILGDRLGAVAGFEPLRPGGRGPNAPPRPPEIRGRRSESRGVPTTPALRRSAVQDTSDTAKRGGINPAASIHWLRHAHASHAIDNGAPITLVSVTLGHADLVWHLAD